MAKSDGGPFSRWLEGIDRQQFVLVLDRIIEYGIYLFALFLFQSKGEVFRSIGLYAPLAAWFIKLCMVRESRLKVSPAAMAFFFFAGSLLLSGLVSMDLMASLRGFQRTVLTAALLFFVISQNFTTWEKLKRLGWVLAFSGGIAVVAGFLNYFKGITVDGGMTAFNVHRNGFAVMLGYLIPFIMAYTVAARTRYEKLFFGGFFLLSLAAMLLTVSRGGWINLLTSLSIWGIFLLRGYARLVLRGAAVIVVVMLVTLWAFPRAILPRAAALQQDVYTITGRVPDLWIPIFEAVKDRPLLGWGPSKVLMERIYPAYYEKAFSKDPMIPFRGTHSFYLSILFYGGFVGLTAYLVFVSILLRRLLKKLVKTVSWSERSVMIAVFSSFVAVYLVHGLLESPSWWRPLGLILGFGEALAAAPAVGDFETEVVRCDLPS